MMVAPLGVSRTVSFSSPLIPDEQAESVSRQNPKRTRGGGIRGCWFMFSSLVLEARLKSNKTPSRSAHGERDGAGQPVALRLLHHDRHRLGDAGGHVIAGLEFRELHIRPGLHRFGIAIGLAEGDG